MTKKIIAAVLVVILMLAGIGAFLYYREDKPNEFIGEAPESHGAAESIHSETPLNTDVEVADTETVKDITPEPEKVEPSPEPEKEPEKEPVVTPTPEVTETPEPSKEPEPVVTPEPSVKSEDEKDEKKEPPKEPEKNGFVYPPGTSTKGLSERDIKQGVYYEIATGNKYDQEGNFRGKYIGDIYDDITTTEDEVQAIGDANEEKAKEIYDGTGEGSDTSNFN